MKGTLVNFLQSLKKIFLERLSRPDFENENVYKGNEELRTTMKNPHSEGLFW